MHGISVNLDDLIQLRHSVTTKQRKPKGQAIRSGAWQSTIRGRGMDFAEVRNYQPGDEIRHMEWRVTARTGKPHVKLYQEERERPVVIVTDFNPSMYFGTKVAFKSVTAARLAALVAWTATKEGDRVGGLIFSPSTLHEFMPRGREHGVLPYLSGLSEYSQKRPQSFDEWRPLSGILMRSRRVIRPGSTLVIISDGYNIDANCTQHLQRIGQHNLVLMYHICDPLERTPPPPATYAISDGHKEIVLDTKQASVHSLWQKDCRARIKKVDDLCKQLMIQKNLVENGDDLAYLVAHTFPRRRHGAI